MNTETHPLPPFAPPDANLLMLVSFPPPHSRWKMNFYYPNLQNDIWRIFGKVFFDDTDYFIDAAAAGKQFKESLIRSFLEEKGIAVTIQRIGCDVCRAMLRISFWKWSSRRIWHRCFRGYLCVKR
ncbi:hypothetical protein [Neisseria iguanae]|uniref:hypothetical protein n=1 Tax=Neisseria iguanae TaxID=90242 RepID=UPI001FECEC77|nr:hypothetical protein [Neisseria iguanae]